MNREPHGAPARGLRRYLGEVCRALRVGPEASCWELDDRANAYVALDGRLPGYPRHDLALVWDEENGWAAALETQCGDDMIILCYLGGDILPHPRVVADFVAELRADEYPGQPDPPALRASFAEDGFEARLAVLAGAAAERGSMASEPTA
ncbi:MAG TPA: DUF6292 family protein [Actinophytocola sp.]|uniref:DUF6292 family protein n=1 Tax=Actinophytocola sp. TaxID=1872138 RepID=UPI002DB9BEF0|nr:DUF6292 family protein [Actinophytocola sp.]HEU5474991.1 DUF6292 family protein [Actinophytocola sp.]